MTYSEALDRIAALEGRPWRSGLDRMREFVGRAGLAPALDGRAYVHVAGTNGKGTTTAFVESILRHQGWRTGAFYSPYVVDYRERIQAEGRMISPDELVGLADRLLPLADTMATTEFGGATKFELEVAMGLSYWEQMACEWVALEVGLGGRLDATNVVTPRVCVITSIGLDHTAILGATLEEIAAEKAGIVKPKVPVVVGKMPIEALAVIERIAADLEAPLWRYGNEVRTEGRGAWTDVSTPAGTFVGVQPAKLGSFSVQNAALAVAACAAAGSLRDLDGLRTGVARTWLPGRYDTRDFHGRTAVFDGAHNADAAKALVATLPQGPLHLVTNMVAGHEVDAFYSPFRGRARRAYVPPIASPRALGIMEAVARIEAAGIPAQGHATVAEALVAALATADATVVVTGSNYLVGEALRLVR